MISDPAALGRMRVAARAEFERKFTAERNYEMLLGIYDKARIHLEQRNCAG